MPLPALPPDPPHAYVVEYRVLDKCFPPACVVKSRDVFGYLNDLQPDGDPGGYVQYGTKNWANRFFRRAKPLIRDESISFVLPPSAADSELDVYFGALDEGTDFGASVTFEELPNTAPPIELLTRTVYGHTEIGALATIADYAHESAVMTHARLAIPSRKGRVVRVTITNRTDETLAVGSPLVMKRVVGRRPRQAIFSIFDAVPYPLFNTLFTGPTHDPKTEWVHEQVSKFGAYFPSGQTPGICTSCFGRCFFRLDYFNAIGEPMHYRGYDEPPPEFVDTLPSELANQGVLTEAIMANSFLTPGNAYEAFDAGYDSEGPEHPKALAARYREWIAEHPEDDSFVVWWLASTHFPFGPGRDGPPVPPPVGLPPTELNAGIYTKIWRNELDSTDRLRDILDAGRARAKSASRLVYLSADHGRGFTGRMNARVYRTGGGGIVQSGLSHAVGGSNEEMSTPFVLFYDDENAIANPTPVVSNETVTSLASLRAFESFFDVKLGLPDTRAFDSAIFSGDGAYSARWDDGMTVSLGLAGVTRILYGQWAYAEYPAHLHEFDLWKQPPSSQRVLEGSGYGTPLVPAEELYDRASDPYEYKNLSEERFDEVLTGRQHAADFMATYDDDRLHARYRYTLTFPSRVTITLTAARAFQAWGDDHPAIMRTSRSAEITGRTIEIQEGERPVGIIEIRGAFAEAPITLRCASNGLPVDVTTDDRGRLNLQVARNNCPVTPTARVTPTENSVMFSFTRAHAETGKNTAIVTPGAGGIVDEKELMEGMKRWGYVRDDKKP